MLTTHFARATKATVIAFATLLGLAISAQAAPLVETPSLADAVKSGTVPAIEQRVPGQQVTMVLELAEPMTSTARYTLQLVDRPAGCLVTWTMEGRHNLVGRVFGLFLIGYGLARVFVEQFRQAALMDALVALQIGKNLPLRPRQARAARVLLETLAQQPRNVMHEKTESLEIVIHDVRSGRKTGNKFTVC